MRLLLAAFAALAVLFTATFILPMRHVHAEDVIQMNSNQQVIMSGTVSDVDQHGFTLTSGATTTHVATDSMAGGTIDSLVKPGMKVTVRGTMGMGMFNEPRILATNISAYQESSPTVVPGVTPGTGAASAAAATTPAPQ